MASNLVVEMNCRLQALNGYTTRILMKPRLAYRAGVTSAVAVPESDGLVRGLGVAFRTGAKNKLSDVAVLQSITAVHVALTMGANSAVSAQIATLRALLKGQGEGELGASFNKVIKVSNRQHSAYHLF
jgi:hypothetical protein